MNRDSGGTCSHKAIQSVDAAGFNIATPTQALVVSTHCTFTSKLASIAPDSLPILSSTLAKSPSVQICTKVKIHDCAPLSTISTQSVQVTFDCSCQALPAAVQSSAAAAESIAVSISLLILPSAHCNFALKLLSGSDVSWPI